MPHPRSEAGGRGRGKPGDQQTGDISAEEGAMERGEIVRHIYPCYKLCFTFVVWRKVVVIFLTLQNMGLKDV